ncbi:unannotated protein [freshwater metagenome]|uniref:Unannotated protein n=1 Tax=freshwater metagenome TaxID=449393 RepID=A0A6J6XCV1_9ZZZZ
MTQNNSTSVVITTTTPACTAFACVTDSVGGTVPSLTVSGLNSGVTTTILLTVYGSAYAGIQDISSAMSFACSAACNVNGSAVSAGGNGSDSYSLAFARLTAVSTSPMSGDVTFLVTVTSTSSITFTGKFKTGVKTSTTVTWPYSGFIAQVIA